MTFDPQIRREFCPNTSWLHRRRDVSERVSTRGTDRGHLPRLSRCIGAVVKSPWRSVAASPPLRSVAGLGPVIKPPS